MVRDAVAHYPNRKNPTMQNRSGFHGGCVYTSQSGKSHCIAGQVFADAGLPVPDYNYYGSIDDFAEWEFGDDVTTAFGPDAWKYLIYAQAIFDGGYAVDIEEPRNMVGPRIWKQALKMLEDAFNAA